MINNIPEWPSTCTKCARVFKGCGYLNAVWDDELTEEELMPSTMTEHADAVFGTDAALRSKFYPSWGGTKQS